MDHSLTDYVRHPTMSHSKYCTPSTSRSMWPRNHAAVARRGLRTAIYFSWFGLSTSQSKELCFPSLTSFTGHEVQRADMINPWIKAFPIISHEFLKKMDAILGFRLSKVMLNGPNLCLNKTKKLAVCNYGYINTNPSNTGR